MERPCCRRDVTRWPLPVSPLLVYVLTYWMIYNCLLWLGLVILLYLFRSYIKKKTSYFNRCKKIQHFHHNLKKEIHTVCLKITWKRAQSKILIGNMPTAVSTIDMIQWSVGWPVSLAARVQTPRYPCSNKFNVYLHGLSILTTLRSLCVRPKLTVNIWKERIG